VNAQNNASFANSQESVSYNPRIIPTNPTFCAVCHGGYGFDNLAMYGFSNEAMAQASEEQLGLLDTVSKGNPDVFNAAFGLAEVGSGFASIVGGGPAGWALGGVAVAHGLDQFGTSSYNYSTGSTRDTLTISGLQSAGLSRNQAGWVDMGIGLLDVGVGLVNVGRNLPEIATNLGRNATRNSDATSALVDNIVIDTYGNLSRRGDISGQAHHLNQNAAYRDVIPTSQGVAIKLEGNMFTDPVAPHTKAHHSLKAFWNQFRGTDVVPTNTQYTRALQESLRACLLID
jgi:hypothetical protein